VSRVIQHFLSPRNCGELEAPDGVGVERDNPWFIRMRMEIKVEAGCIRDVRFKTAGCVTAVASMSALTELVRQGSLESALATTPTDIAGALGGVPTEKLHCCDLAIRCLRRAIWDYQVHAEGSISAGALCALP